MNSYDPALNPSYEDVFILVSSYDTADEENKEIILRELNAKKNTIELMLKEEQGPWALLAIHAKQLLESKNSTFKKLDYYVSKQEKFFIAYILTVYPGLILFFLGLFWSDPGFGEFLSVTGATLLLIALLIFYFSVRKDKQGII